MKTYTKTQTFKLFTFDELNAEAQERVEENYLNDELTLCIKAQIFEEFVKDELEALTGGAFVPVDVDYSLNYCQGDGVEISGTLNALTYLKENEKDYNGGFFTEEEYLKAVHLLEEYGTDLIIETYYHCGSPYSHKVFGVIDYVYNYVLMEEEEEAEALRILNRLEGALINDYKEFCHKMKEAGYELFYELSEADYEELNEYYYLENGEKFDLIENVD